MKNKKFSLLLNIATICLCVCAIAIGVYSAKQASLTVSGTIGFEAHNCMVEVSGSYSACSSTSATSRTTTDLTTTTVGGTESATKEISNLSLFFSDYATDGDEIVFNLTITNKSNYKITVKAPAPTLTNTSGEAITGVICTSSDEKFTLEAKDEEGASKTITLTYKLDDIDNASDITDGKFSITLNFEKWEFQQFYTESVTEKLYIDSAWTDVTTTKLCTTMGHSIVGTGAGTDGETEIPIQWYAFAVRGEKTSDNNYNTKPTAIFGDSTPLSITNKYTDNETTINETWYSLYGVDMSKVNYKGYTFWFIQQYVTAGGYYMSEDESSYRDGVEFDDVLLYLYSETEMWTYLTDTETSTNYLSATGIKKDELFNSVDERTMYDYDASGEDCYVSCKLWLVNTNEKSLLVDNNVSGGSVTKTPGIGNKNLAKSYSNNGAGWYTRSAGNANRANEVFTVYAINFAGETIEKDVDETGSLFGVRAAFQISIAG